MNADQADEYHYPIFMRPKLRGVYCRIENGMAVDNHGQSFANKMMCDILSGLPPFEGRIIVGEPTDEDADSDTLDVINSASLFIDFNLWACDVALRTPYPFNERLGLMANWVVTCHSPCVRLVEYAMAKTPAGLLAYEKKQVDLGHLGVIIHGPDEYYIRPSKRPH